MAGGGLVAIKRRIRSISSTQKITKAMGLIATSKLRKVRKKLEVNQKYYDAFNHIVNDLVKNIEDRNIYVHGNGSKKKLYITLNSDSGLCGGFNANIVNTAAPIILEDKENNLLISVGQKGRMYFNRMKCETISEYVDIPDIPTLKESSTITYKILDMYRKGEVGEVYIIYTKFHSTVKQDITVEKILPLENKDEESPNHFVKFEPSINQMIEDVIVMHLKQQILNFMFNSKVSEQGSRMSAMDGATKNSNDLLDKLNLKYNRERQGAITQEITEIVSGAEALK
ncbi:F0F1 ATP synthase subunit gamma [Clostridium fermenticellae]|uniref:ATP synthase gamma chain n=1 Tax=Clostridium fermenticellae TaxID=2068654 RepID=A0A386H0X0_9CLOT|nr:ATP synthase F1 subunit gamma [Clostridium fermenticellae]AYD39203.1 F0F1 ATP synthase subunit gamma [Clostridium fermenticellae]